MTLSFPVSSRMDALLHVLTQGVEQFPRFVICFISSVKMNDKSLKQKRKKHLLNGHGNISLFRLPIRTFKATVISVVKFLRACLNF